MQIASPWIMSLQPPPPPHPPPPPPSPVFSSHSIKTQILHPSSSASPPPCSHLPHTQMLTSPPLGPTPSSYPSYEYTKPVLRKGDGQGEEVDVEMPHVRRLSVPPRPPSFYNTKPIQSQLSAREVFILRRSDSETVSDCNATICAVHPFSFLFFLCVCVCVCVCVCLCVFVCLCVLLLLLFCVYFIYLLIFLWFFFFIDFLLGGGGGGEAGHSLRWHYVSDRHIKQRFLGALFSTAGLFRWMKDSQFTRFLCRHCGVVKR